jgi:hypothetical protein
MEGNMLSARAPDTTPAHQSTNCLHGVVQAVHAFDRCREYSLPNMLAAAHNNAYWLAHSPAPSTATHAHASSCPVPSV